MRSTDYGDGRVYRNVSIAELKEGRAMRVSDYCGEAFDGRGGASHLAAPLDMRGWPAGADLQGDEDAA